MEKILLLEDDTTLSRGVSMALSESTRTVILADCLTQAQKKLEENSFDLLILDINLPDGSGLDLLRWLRANGHSTPVILLTANDLEIDEVTGLEAGADDYIIALPERRSATALEFYKTNLLLQSQIPKPERSTMRAAFRRSHNSTKCVK